MTITRTTTYEIRNDAGQLVAKASSKAKAQAAAVAIAALGGSKTQVLAGLRGLKAQGVISVYSVAWLAAQ